VIKKILFIIVWVVLVAGLFVMLGFVNKQHQSETCNKFDIFIKYNSNDYFITNDDVQAFLAQKGIKIKGAQLNDINVGNIEALLYTIPCIKKADVFVSILGDVQINILQRKPIVKVFNKYGQSFYIDDEGMMMQASDKYSARLIVANGFIRDFYNPLTKLDISDSTSADTVTMKTSIYKVYRLIQFISTDDFWKAMVEEIFINNKGEIELYTKIGSQTVIFGGIDNMEEKFSNLLVFYKQWLNKVGWEKYKTINLKYKNQVVCSKI
jgi:cell division protein FtsQ